MQMLKRVRAGGVRVDVNERAVIRARKLATKGASRPSSSSQMHWPSLSSYPNPASLARMMASARSATWSLLKMLETWLRTVFSLSTSRFAMA